jgi:hypothetical protein
MIMPFIIKVITVANTAKPPLVLIITNFTNLRLSYRQTALFMCTYSITNYIPVFYLSYIPLHSPPTT